MIFRKKWLFRERMAVQNGGVYYYVEIKRGDRNFVTEEEKKKFKELFDKFELASA